MTWTVAIIAAVLAVGVVSFWAVVAAMSRALAQQLADERELANMTRPRAGSVVVRYAPPRAVRKASRLRPAFRIELRHLKLAHR